jgi:hypothetical protein
LNHKVVSSRDTLLMNQTANQTLCTRLGFTLSSSGGKALCGSLTGRVRSKINCPTPQAQYAAQPKPRVKRMLMADRCCSEVRKPVQDIARRSGKDHVSYHMPRSTSAIAVTLPNRAESLARHLDSEIQLEILAFSPASSPAFPELLLGSCIDDGGVSGGGSTLCEQLYGPTLAHFAKSSGDLHIYLDFARSICMRAEGKFQGTSIQYLLPYCATPWALAYFIPHIRGQWNNRPYCASTSSRCFFGQKPILVRRTVRNSTGEAASPRSCSMRAQEGQRRLGKASWLWQSLA